MMKLPALSLLTLLATSCVSVKGVKQDESFTPYALKDRGVVVAEIIKGDDIDESEVKLPSTKMLASLLKDELRDDREDIKLVSTGSFWKKMPASLKGQWEASLKETESIDPKTLRDLPMYRPYVVVGIVRSTGVKKKNWSRQNKGNTEYTYETKLA